jgi:MFS family permease
LGLSRGQIGKLAAAFALTDAPSGPWMGRLADRFGVERPCCWCLPSARPAS